MQDRKHEQPAVRAVEDSPVPRQDCTRILHSIMALESGLDKVPQLAEYRNHDTHEQKFYERDVKRT